MPIRSKLPDVGVTIFAVNSRRARELGALNLGQGFPDYDIDPRITELVNEAMRAGHNQYAPYDGVVELREQIAKKVAHSYGVNVDPLTEVTVPCHPQNEGGAVMRRRPGSSSRARERGQFR